MREPVTSTIISGEELDELLDAFRAASLATSTLVAGKFSTVLALVIGRAIGLAYAQSNDIPDSVFEAIDNAFIYGARIVECRCPNCKAARAKATADVANLFRRTSKKSGKGE